MAIHVIYCQSCLEAGKRKVLGWGSSPTMQHKITCGDHPKPKHDPTKLIQPKRALSSLFTVDELPDPAKHDAHLAAHASLTEHLSVCQKCGTNEDGSGGTARRYCGKGDALRTAAEIATNDHVAAQQVGFEAMRDRFV